MQDHKHFTFRSYELETLNDSIFEPISDLDITIESFSSLFSPFRASSPICQSTQHQKHNVILAVSNQKDHS